MAVDPERLDGDAAPPEPAALTEPAELEMVEPEDEEVGSRKLPFAFAKRHRVLITDYTDDHAEAAFIDGLTPRDAGTIIRYNGRRYEF